MFHIIDIQVDLHIIRHVMKKAVKNISDNAVALLAEIGPLIGQHRKSFNITANAAAETAGISRVTLHRIEKGEPTVSIGAYLNVISALDLTLNLSARADAGYEADGDSVGTLPVRVSLKDYPQLKQLAWHVQGADELSFDFENLSDREQALIKLLKFAFESVVL